MKNTLAALLLSASVAFAADGYQHQTNFDGLSDLKVKTGDIVKVRNFNKERISPSGPSVDVLIFYRRNIDNEIKLKMTAQDWALLEHSNTMYLRRSGEQWELLGTEIYRDAKGQIKFR